MFCEAYEVRPSIFGDLLVVLVRLVDGIFRFVSAIGGVIERGLTFSTLLLGLLGESKRPLIRDAVAHSPSSPFRIAAPSRQGDSLSGNGDTGCH